MQSKNNLLKEKTLIFLKLKNNIEVYLKLYKRNQLI